MSAKVTVIIYILVTLEIGVLLLFLPWYSQFWEENFFLYLMAEKLNASWLPAFITSGWVRGGVSGLGLFNIVTGIREIINFRQSVAALNQRLSRSNRAVPPAQSVQPEIMTNEDHRETTDHPSPPGETGLSDHQSTELPPRVQSQ